MCIIVYEDGRTEWHFWRKAYRKARWRRLGQRMVDDFIKNGFHGLIVV